MTESMLLSGEIYRVSTTCFQECLRGSGKIGYLDERGTPLTRTFAHFAKVRANAHHSQRSETTLE